MRGVCHGPTPVSAQRVIAHHDPEAQANVRAVRSLREPPIVIRAEPLRKKKDVPLNVKPVVVFSEPMNAATVTTESVGLPLPAAMRRAVPCRKRKPLI